MSTAKAILGIVPTMQSVALAGEAYKAVPKGKKKTSVKKMLKSGANIIIGSSLIKTNAEFIGGMD